MTSRSSQSPPYRVNRTPVPKLARSAAVLRAGLISLAVAVMIFGFLTLQMAAGGDPALGNDRTASRVGAAAPASPTPAVAAITEDDAEEPTVLPAAPVVQPAPAPAPVQTTTS
jgi:hypothetical protein